MLTDAAGLLVADEMEHGATALRVQTSGREAHVGYAHQGHQRGCAAVHALFAQAAPGASLRPAAGP
jgi:hypothetical protein